MSTQDALAKEIQEVYETDGTLLVGTGEGFSTLTPGTDDQVLTVVDGVPAWADATAGTGATDFTDLGDAPASYTGAASKFVKVKGDETGLEFVAGSSTAVAWGAITGTLASQTDLTTALGLRQPLDATLTALTGLTTAANKLIYATGSDTFATADLTSYSRGLLGLSDAASWRTSLGVSTGGGSSVYDTVVHIVDSTYGTGLIDAAAHIQGYINAAAIAGGVVIIPKGIYRIEASLVIPSNVTLEGQGIDVTILKLKNGANQSVITTTNTSTLISSTTSAEGAQHWGIKNLSIDGNKANNTSGHGIYTYSRAYVLDNVKITYCKERGIYSKWGYTAASWSDSDALASDPFMEAKVSNIFVGYCDKEGIYWDGPHDSIISNTYVALCSHSSANSYDGIYVGAGAGGTLWTNVHPWGDTHRYNWNISGGWTTFTGCVSDDGYTAGVYINADHVTWTGGVIFGAVFGSPDADDLAYKGIILSSNAWYPHIVTQAINCSKGAIDFTSAPAASPGTIIITGSMDASLNSGTTTYGYVGTPPSTMNVQIRIFDPDMNDSYSGTTTALTQYSQSVVLLPRSTTPTDISWTAGQVYYDTTQASLRFYDGAAWQNTNLPAQSGNGNKLLTTNGSVPSWSPALKLYTNTVQFNARSGTPSDVTWAAGQVYYDTSTNKLRCFNGTAWYDLF